jgi:DNA polymerase III sliding clamp (beta) subunit (PCNA family)
MLIIKKSLQDALGIVKPGLAGKEVIEQSTSFAFLAGRVVTYNDEISLSHPVEGLDLEGAIESDKLYQFLARVKQEEIDIEISDTEIIVTAGKAKAGFPLQSEIKLPLDEELGKKGKWKPIPASFTKFVNMSIPSCSTVSTKPKLGCVHITQDGIIEASDGYRITNCTLPEGETIQVHTFLIPSKSAKLMTQLNPTHIAEGKGWIHFKTEAGTILSCRILAADEFPDTVPHLNVKGVKIIFPKTITSIMDRAGVFSKDLGENTDSININLENKKLTVSARNSLGWFEEEVNARYEGNPIQFQIPPILLKDILSETQQGELTKNKLVFRGEGWIYLTTLMAVK